MEIQDLLKLEITDLIAEDFNVDLLGFSEEELSDILGFDEPKAGLTEDEDIPEVQDNTQTKLGDVWVLGSIDLCVETAQALMIFKRS